MATSPTSYLQTLAKDEAIAFVASLQKVKDHLSQELQWVSEQVQQKTAQLQGIETLLVEAKTLGLVETADHPQETKAAVAGIEAPPAAVINAPLESSFERSDPGNGKTSPDESVAPLADTIAALPVKPPLAKQRRKTEKVTAAKTLPSAQPSTTSKTSEPKAKQPKSATPATGKATQQGKGSGLQRFLKREFREKGLTEAVSDILNHTTVPLSTDELMAALYDGLPKADYERAKHSLANILSVGKTKGAWTSTGRGRYGGKAIAPA